MNTLIISTDPAHSLGDALSKDLSSGEIERVAGDIPLYAVESDTRDAVESFRKLLASLGGEKGWAGVAENLGISEFADVLDTVPPGADELIALVAVLDVVDANEGGVKFDRVFIDTAPTGHTVRFLTFPDFLDRFLTHAISLRERFASARGVVGNVATLLGGGRVDVEGGLDVALEKVVAYRDRMVSLAQLFRNPERSEFVVVTIATGLAVEESRRLITTLWEEGIWTRLVVVNQILPERKHVVMDRYLKQVRKGQTAQISFAVERIADQFGLAVTLVPRFDTEVRGVYGLNALSKIAFKEARHKRYGALFEQDVMVVNGKESQFIFVGGKGGVGKTSISASLGVELANRGFKTLVLSTDPAHSLSDALKVSLEGGNPVPIELPDESGLLFAMEIDTAAAIEDFKRLVSEFVAEGRRGAGVDLARKFGLDEFAALLDTAPPGIDELVALTQVMELVKFGDFDRVVVDTAPTGHTLRLLSFPQFLDTFLGKIIRLKRRLDAGIDALRNVLGRKEDGDAVDRAAKGVGKMRDNMVQLGDLITNQDRTQFCIVTVPTALAMAESERLVVSLRKDNVKVDNLIINQIIPEASTASYVERIVNDQKRCIEELGQAGENKNISFIQVPFFDVEVRGIYGLSAMADTMFSKTPSDI